VVLFFWHEQKLVVQIDPYRDDVEKVAYAEALSRNPVTAEHLPPF
jgi:formate-dependent nitrite reductase cytochrome c552 subunit